MTKVEWILLIVVVALLIGPFVTLKAVAGIRRRRASGETKIPVSRPYDDEEDDN
jgi:hypothetical protein